VTTEGVVAEFGAERVDVEGISPVSCSEDSLPSGHDLHVVQAAPTREYRVFRAPIRLWGASVVEPGKLLDCRWFLIRGSDGQWRVFDQDQG
jgi:hypothetical protein